MSMDCIFNKEKLSRVLYDFYKSTGIAIAMYDANEELVANSPVYCEYCSLIRSKKVCVESCDVSNLIHMKEVASSRDVSRYTCHAGLMETILPIDYEGVLIAYLQIGQFKDAEKEYSSEERALECAERYGFDVEELRNRYAGLETVSAEKLSAVCSILEILIKSFWEEGLITYKRSMLSVRIESYIAENLSGNIYVSDLCERFQLSKNALYKLFNEEFGGTVNEYIVKKRLSAAQNMLKKNSELNVTEIAMLCGFSDYNYFIRAFKKQFGITPLKYRNKKI